MSNLELKGALQDRKQKKMELAINADSKMKAIKHLLATSSIRQISEIDIEGVASIANELLRLKWEYLTLLDDIRKIERELE
jgi:hypothetical protein